MVYGIGIMSGTSLDGIDVAIVKISDRDSNQATYELVDFDSYSFEEDTKKRIMASLAAETSDVALICSLNIELGYLFGEAVIKLCHKNDLLSQDVWFVSSHGQTIYHNPIKTSDMYASTLQIGESSVISEVVKTNVVSDFRYRDMAVGGQGAPIVPYSEYVLYREENKLRILQNIGGISNATIIPKHAELHDVLAFDTGPGNMIIDELCRHFYNQEYDEDGLYAKAGCVNETILNRMLMHPFIKKSRPKSTGREDFGKHYVLELLENYPDIAANDWIKTATVFTAKAIGISLNEYNQIGTELIVGGGGSYNSELVRLIKNELPLMKVMIQEDIGLSSDAKEAVAMVVLGHRTMNHLPSNVPSATGAQRDVIMGKITYY